MKGRVVRWAERGGTLCYFVWLGGAIVCTCLAVRGWAGLGLARRGGAGQVKGRPRKPHL